MAKYKQVVDAVQFDGTLDCMKCFPEEDQKYFSTEGTILNIGTINNHRIIYLNDYVIRDNRDPNAKEPWEYYHGIRREYFESMFVPAIKKEDKECDIDIDELSGYAKMSRLLYGLFRSLDLNDDNFFVVQVGSKSIRLKLEGTISLEIIGKINEFAKENNLIGEALAFNENGSKLWITLRIKE